MSRQPLATHPAHHGLTSSGSWGGCEAGWQGLSGQMAVGTWDSNGSQCSPEVMAGPRGWQWLSVSPGFTVSSGWQWLSVSPGVPGGLSVPRRPWLAGDRGPLRAVAAWPQRWRGAGQRIPPGPGG